MDTVYVVVHSIDGVLDIDYAFLQEAFPSDGTDYYVALRPGVEVRDSWQVVTGEDFNKARPQVKVPEIAPVALESVQAQLTALGQGLALLALK